MLIIQSCNGFFWDPRTLGGHTFSFIRSLVVVSKKSPLTTRKFVQTKKLRTKQDLQSRCIRRTLLLSSKRVLQIGNNSHKLFMTNYVREQVTFLGDKISTLLCGNFEVFSRFCTSHGFTSGSFDNDHDSRRTPPREIIRQRPRQSSYPRVNRLPNRPPRNKTRWCTNYDKVPADDSKKVDD